MEEIEKAIIIGKREKHHGNIAHVARVLQVGTTALYDKMKRYDITPKELR